MVCRDVLVSIFLLVCDFDANKFWIWFSDDVLRMKYFVSIFLMVVKDFVYECDEKGVWLFVGLVFVDVLDF